jgi:hypothetical protein
MAMVTVDADDGVVDQRAVPYPYPTRGEAVETIECVMTRFEKSGYELRDSSGGR